MIGVLDGHGQNGHLISEFVKVQMPRILEQKVCDEIETQKKKSITNKSKEKLLKKSGKKLPPLAEQKKDTDFKSNWMTFDPEVRDEIISESFKDTHEAIKGRILADFSGTTCVMGFVWNDLFVCANSGDSRAILCLKSRVSHKWELHVLSRDHKPSERDEAFRVRC